MENEQNMRVDHPRNILYQVSKSMNGKHDDLRATLSSQSTWKTAIRAAEEAMGDIDESIYLMPPSSGTTNRRRVREMALAFAQSDQTATAASPLGPGYGQRVRTSPNSDISRSGPPRRASEATRQRLRETAKKLASEPWRDPYANIRAGMIEGHLPIVTANVRAYAIDDARAGKLGELDRVDMIWDTGSHRTIITEELLPESFREYLQTPVHDPYRCGGGSSVQVDAEIAMTNHLVLTSTVAIIVPQAKMPNQFRGILFGQVSCINRIRYESIPRCFLIANGEDVGEDVWGDFIVKEYFDENDEIVVV